MYILNFNNRYLEHITYISNIATVIIRATHRYILQVSYVLICHLIISQLS